MNKTVHGFDGEVYVEIYADRQANMAPGWNAGTPPDFDLIAEFDFGAYGMECETYPQESLAVVKSSSADVDRISDAMEDLLDYIEAELGDELVPWVEE